ncbi:hypothetical protein SDJN02_21273, partial [Cucurbita argyrosperma subsp. argyrosperma]
MSYHQTGKSKREKREACGLLSSAFSRTRS